MSDKTLAKLLKLSNPTVLEYLHMMDNTETPAIFHVWSLISAASACLTRRCWFNLGPIKITPNQYIMLVGPSGARKSASISFLRGLLKDLEGLRFGPNNTAGRSQGLIAAMQGKRTQAAEADDAVAEVMESLGASLNIGMLTEDEEGALGSVHMLNRHALYIAESELVSFLGVKSNEFTDFLGDMWDRSGMDYYIYQLKRETTKVDLPCLNMIGGITPSHITSYLPATAIGQGFTSRVIMVYSDPGKQVAWPDPLDEAKVNGFRKLFRHIFETFEGAFEYEPGVKELVIKLYNYKIKIDDIRFLHYSQRRQTHMLKVAMALAALRLSRTVSENDIQDAHDLMVLTEKRMPECLGEYGMSPLALAMSRISEKLKNSDEPLTLHRLLIAIGSDVRRLEATRALNELTDLNQVIEVHLKDAQGIVKTGYVWPRDTNPFKAFEEIAVEYLHDEGGRTSARETTKRSLDALGEDQLPARRPVKPVDYASLPDAAIAEIAEVAGIAAQGYASVTEKLSAFLEARNKGRTLQ